MIYGGCQGKHVANTGASWDDYAQNSGKSELHVEIFII